jgi:hypothetical protein
MTTNITYFQVSATVIPTIAVAVLVSGRLLTRPVPEPQKLELIINDDALEDPAVLHLGNDEPVDELSRGFDEAFRSSRKQLQNELEMTRYEYDLYTSLWRHTLNFIVFVVFMVATVLGEATSLKALHDGSASHSNSTRLSRSLFVIGTTIVLLLLVDVVTRFRALLHRIMIAEGGQNYNSRSALATGFLIFVLIIIAAATFFSIAIV